MSVALSYPGVYLVETSDFPVSVTPATTSLTAFIGPFQKGPVNEATLVTTWSEFTSQFGTAIPSSLASYAVSQFFLNGGTGAWIVRIATEGAPVATGTLGPLTITANSPGAWASGLAIEIEPYTPPGNPGIVRATMVVQTPSSPATTLETLTNLPVDPENPQVLAAAITARSSFVVAAPLTSPPSSLAAWTSPPSGPLPASVLTSPPAGTSTTLSTVADSVFTAPTYADAVSAMLEQPGPLDQIAPQVFNLMCIPDAVWLDSATMTKLFQQARDYCAARQAFLLVDPPPPEAAQGPAWALATPLQNVGANTTPLIESLAELLTPEGISGAVYYPWVQILDPTTQAPLLAPPSGTIAGLYAATDAARGVWKAPAGVTVGLQGVSQLADPTLNDTLNGQLNDAGVNCLRTFPVYGTVVWGARTLAGNNLIPTAWKYVSVRRLTDFIEQSLMQSLRWAVFEPNGPSLWATISLEVGSFMADLYGQGALSGATAAQAFQVTCDATTTSSADMQNGVVNIQVGFQPVEPAEFVVLNLAVTSAAAAS